MIYISDAINMLNDSKSESEKHEKILIMLDEFSLLLERISLDGSPTGQAIDRHLGKLYENIRQMRMNINLEVGPVTQKERDDFHSTKIIS
jgi:hypothetical protein